MSSVAMPRTHSRTGGGDKETPTIGNALAPWMIFFQGSAVLDKGLTHRDLRIARLDTALGSIVQSLIAAAIVVCGAALFRYAQVHPGALSEPVAMLHGYGAQFGFLVRDLFALGLVNAGFLAAITISLSTSWTFASVFGWAKSLNDTLRQAPRFYALYIGGLVAAAVLVLIPGLPLVTLAVLTQVIAGILMSPLIVFLVVLTSDRAVMGAYRNSRFATVRIWIIAAAIILATVVLLIQGL